MPRDAGRLVREAQRRTQQAVRSMAGGSMEGRTTQAAPLPERPRAAPYRAAPSVEIATFSTASAVAVTQLSRVYEVIYGGRSLSVIANLVDALGAPETLTGDTTIDVLVNGVAVGTVTIASGDSRGTIALAEVTEPEDLITLETTAVGTGTAYATVQVHVKR